MMSFLLILKIVFLLFLFKYSLPLRSAPAEKITYCRFQILRF